MPRGAEHRITPGKTKTMAADWIPMRIDLRDDPAVIAIAAATGLDEDAVAGKLLRLWGWANRQLTNGCAPRVTDSWVDRFLSAPGFAAAMLCAGWLQTRSGQIEFPKFDRWNSQGAKRRILAAHRMRKLRDGPSATKAQPEKRREEKKKYINPAAAEIAIPAELDSPEFRAVWSEWIADRKERRHEVTPRAARGQFKKLIPLGIPGAIACIEASIANGWQGLFPERFKPGSKPAFQTHDDRVADVLFGGPANG